MNGQMTLFDFTMSEIRIEKPIRLIELFAGIGSQAMALRDIGAKFEHYKVVEFDKYAIASYNAIHGTDFEPIDILDLSGNDLQITDKDSFIYLLTYSFPCQDLSNSGLRKGMKKGSGTRSGLLWEVERLLNETPELPQILLMENVPAVQGEQNRADFQMWLDFLTSKGYTNYVNLLNAKDYGTAQNRLRCFCVSLLGEYNYHWPEPIPLDKTIEDYLEDEVGEEYYIKSGKAKKLIEQLLDSDKLSGGGTREQWLTQAFSTRNREKSQAQSQQRTGQSSTQSRRVTVSLSNKEIGGQIDIAHTLMARDFKGYGNLQQGNGVIEIGQSE